MSVKKCPPGHKHSQTQTCYTKHGCRCKPCRLARAAARNPYEWEDRRRKGADVRISALGTRRRLQALALSGYSIADVAALVGRHPKPLSYLRGGKLSEVHTSTAERVARVFEARVMHPRTDRQGKITRTRALQAGWIPALAYDDIDTDRIPKGVAA